MGPLGIGLLTTGLGVAGDLFGGILGHSAQSKANKTNIKLQREQQQWEERMSNTSWQRGTQDMLKAGINPMLAVSQGGASTPNVNAAQVIPEDAFATSARNAGNKLMQSIVIQRQAADAATASEIAKQERIRTDAMEVDYNQTGDYYKRLYDQTEKLKQERISATAKAILDKTDTEIRQLELEILQKTKDSKISSAQQQADLLKAEVSFKEAQTILAQLGEPEARATAEWFEKVGAASPATKAIMSIGQWLKIVFGGK